MHGNDSKTYVCFWGISDITCIDIRFEEGTAKNESEMNRNQKNVEDSETVPDDP